ncbi:hypothetical protein [Nocardioides acrostichi]|uniref:Uncharacterized protein n=1 Tax=Nocardioides acrostichi TaxID=2784339 RepID=A0A930USW9_9ACTN|nr:hypothetical protein [Nocardioides acrostichi]MBF4160248.1 hypothetical protein [Nocardioides acrostichi]
MSGDQWGGVVFGVVMATMGVWQLVRARAITEAAMRRHEHAVRRHGHRSPWLRPSSAHHRPSVTGTRWRGGFFCVLALIAFAAAAGDGISSPTR